jgi:hypothetical protein
MENILRAYYIHIDIIRRRMQRRRAIPNNNKKGGVKNVKCCKTRQGRRQCGGAEFDTGCEMCGYIVGLDFQEYLKTLSELMPSEPLKKAVLDIDTRWMQYHQLSMLGGVVYLGHGTSGRFDVLDVSDESMWHGVKDISFFEEIHDHPHHIHCVAQKNNTDHLAWVKQYSDTYQSDSNYDFFNPLINDLPYKCDASDLLCPDDVAELFGDYHSIEPSARPKSNEFKVLRRLYSQLTLADITALRDRFVPPGLRDPLTMKAFLAKWDGTSRPRAVVADHQKALGWSWKTFDNQTLLVPRLRELAKDHAVQIHDLLIALRVTGTTTAVESWYNDVIMLDLNGGGGAGGGGGGGGGGKTTKSKTRGTTNAPKGKAKAKAKAKGKGDKVGKTVVPAKNKKRA